MTALYNNREIRDIEKLAIEAGIPEYQLMENAAHAALAVLKEKWPDNQNVIVFTGKGNNGGDGYVLARLAHEQSITVSVCSVISPEELKSTAKKAYEACLAAGVEIEQYAGDFDFTTSTLIVDALLGSGLVGEVTGTYAELIEAINAAEKPVLALDVPSGLNADTGCILTVAVQAAVTVTFIGYKRGCYTRKAPTYCGELILDTLAIEPPVRSRIEPSVNLIHWNDVRSSLPKRQVDTHKGDCGHVLVIGGDYGMGGAVRMAAEAAMRVGSGLVTVATRPEHVPVVSGSRPELMCHQVADTHELEPLLERATVIVIGPGLGKTPWAEGLLNRVLQSDLPKLLDADALNLLSESPQKSDSWVLTPHPGEAGRLLDTSCQDVQHDRFAAVEKLQAAYGGVAVLKGVGTLIKGHVKKLSLCEAGNPGMASGGMGDVLSGIIGGLLAQKLDLLTAARVGVLVHATAADRAAVEGGERGLLATDVLAQLRSLVNPS